MARPRRIDLPFSLYHVFSRTISGEKAFLDERDQKKFFYYLEKYLDLYSFRLHCWCIMSNHFHLLLESAETDGLTKLMHRLLTAYTVYFNRRHARHGHFFQGRFKSLIIDKPSYLLAVSRYIHLNPTDGNASQNPEKYKGSSLRFYINGGEPDYLYTEEILKWFEGDRSKYAEFIKEGMDENVKPDVLSQRYIGGKAFAKRTKQRIQAIEKRNKSIKSMQPGAVTKEQLNAEEKAADILKKVATYFGITGEMIRNRRHSRLDDTRKARKIFIYLLRDNLPWTIRQIAKYMDLKQESGIHVHIRDVRDDPGMLRNAGDISEELNIDKYRG